MEERSSATRRPQTAAHTPADAREVCSGGEPAAVGPGQLGPDRQGARGLAARGVGTLPL